MQPYRFPKGLSVMLFENAVDISKNSSAAPRGFAPEALARNVFLPCLSGMLLISVE